MTSMIPFVWQCRNITTLRIFMAGYRWWASWPRRSGSWIRCPTFPCWCARTGAARSTSSWKRSAAHCSAAACWPRCCSWPRTFRRTAFGLPCRPCSRPGPLSRSRKIYLHQLLNVVCQHVLDVPHKCAIAFVLVMERVVVFVRVARQHRVLLPYLRNIVRGETPAYLVQLLRHYVQIAHV